MSNHPTPSAMRPSKLLFSAPNCFPRDCVRDHWSSIFSCFHPSVAFPTPRVIHEYMPHPKRERAEISQLRGRTSLAAPAVLLLCSWLLRSPRRQHCCCCCCRWCRCHLCCCCACLRRSHGSAEAGQLAKGVSKAAGHLPGRAEGHRRGSGGMIGLSCSLPKWHLELAACPVLPPLEPRTTCPPQAAAAMQCTAECLSGYNSAMSHLQRLLDPSGQLGQRAGELPSRVHRSCVPGRQTEGEQSCKSGSRAGIRGGTPSQAPAPAAAAALHQHQTQQPPHLASTSSTEAQSPWCRITRPMHCTHAR